MNSPLLLLFFGGLLLTIGDLLMKQWIKVTNGSSLLSMPYLLGMVAYVAGLTFYAYTLRSKHIAIATVILILFNLITLLIVDHFFFGERYSMLHLAGIAIGMVAVLLLEL
jgi:multidrug transporter EmrE-like cation transporter